MAVARVMISGTGNTAPIGLPMKQQDFSGSGGTSMLVNFSGGGPAVGTVTVQVSNDPTALSTPLTARWNNHDTLNALTADANGTTIAPVYAVRLNCSAYTSGSITLDIGYGDQL